MHEQADWIDLPNDDYTLILGYATYNVRKVSKLIATYNSIDKVIVENLPSRIAALQNIVKHVDEWLSQRLTGLEKVKHLRWIQGIALRKSLYLNRLEELYTNNLHCPEMLELYHTDTSALTDRDLSPLLLNKRSFFSLKMREYWGDFWLESIDPCHRRLTPYYHQWKRAKENDLNLPHLFMWLENQYLPKYIPTVKYLDDAELAQTLMTIKEGLLTQGGFPVDFMDPSERYLFAIDLTKQLFIVQENKGCSHSSFTHGKPVLGAGLMKVDHGQLKSIVLESGHYLPTVEAGYQIVTILFEMGISWPGPLEVVYFYDRNKYTTKIEIDDLTSLGIFKSKLESTRKLSSIGADYEQSICPS